MRRSYFRPLLLAGVASVVGAAMLVVRLASPTKTGAIDEDVQRMLDRVVIPRVELQDATLPEAVAYLNRTLARSPETARYRFAIWTKAEPPPGFIPQSRTDLIPGLVDTPATQNQEVNDVLQKDADPRITIVLNNIPLGEAAIYVGTLGGGGRVSFQQGNTLYFVKGFVGPFIERTVTVHPKSRLASLHDAKAIEATFKAHQVEFPAGSEVRFLSADRLLIRTLPSDMDLIDYFVRFDPTPREQLLHWKENWRDELRSRLTPRPSPTGPVCHVGEPLNDSWGR